MQDSNKGRQFYKLFGMLWEIQGQEAIPRCINDNCELTYEDSFDPYKDYYAECPKCKNKILLEKPIWEIAEDAMKVIKSIDLKNTKIINLDDEYFVLNSAKTKDEDYWIRTTVNENKNGETQVMILVGSLKDKNKAQLFLNIDNEKLGFDQNDTNPLKILAKVEATFKNSKSIIEKNKENSSHTK